MAPPKRTLLFIPALAEKFLAKAHERGADAIIVDLEDSIPAAQKDKARAALPAAVALLQQRGLAVWVRVNNVAELLADDLAAAAAAGVEGILIPKVERPGEVESFDAALAALERRHGRDANSLRLALTVESPAGALAAAALPAPPRLAGLAFGAEDFAAALAVPPTPAGMRVPAQIVALAALAQGREAWGLAGSVANHTKLAQYRRAVLLSRALGFTGVLCIHPDQVAVVAAVYAPSEEELAWAREVVERYDEARTRGSGSITVQGQMVDEPVYARARGLLRRHRA